jgi:AraC-like DNA-binding protein
MDIECNTASLDARRRTGVWLDTLRAAFGSVNITSARHGEHLFGQLKSSGRGALRFNELRYGGQCHHRTPANIARLSNEYITLTRPNAGRLEVDYGNARCVLEPGKLYLFNHAVPYFATPSGEYGTRSIAFPASALQQRGVKLDPVQFVQSASRQGVLIGALADQLTTDFSQWNDHEFDVLSGQLLDLIALFYSRPGSAGSNEESSVRAAHLQRALACIRANFGDSALSPAAVAAACGISVGYLHNLFRSTGAGVEATIISERLEHSKQLLLSPRSAHLSIGTIAYMSGFTHPAHFSRAFRDRFGCSARELRASQADGS